MFRFQPYFTIAALAVFLFLAVGYYQRCRNIDSLISDNVSLSYQISRYEQIQENVTSLDKHYTQQFSEEKNEIDRLNARVAAGDVGLSISASCSDDTPETSTTPSVANGKTARLTDTAKRDYFTLRQRIATNEQQILGLQDYIKTVCLK